MDLLKQGIPHTCDLFEGISRVSGLSPTHFGKRGGESGFSHQNLTLAYRAVIGHMIQQFQPINIVANLKSNHIHSELGLKRIFVHHVGFSRTEHWRF